MSWACIEATAFASAPPKRWPPTPYRTVVRASCTVPVPATDLGSGSGSVRFMSPPDSGMRIQSRSSALPPTLMVPTLSCQMLV